jgi:hypothetical protein
LYITPVPIAIHNTTVVSSGSAPGVIYCVSK